MICVIFFQNKTLSCDPNKSCKIAQSKDYKDGSLRKNNSYENVFLYKNLKNSRFGTTSAK